MIMHLVFFSILLKYYFQVSFTLEVILYTANIDQNAEWFQNVLAEVAINGREIPFELRTGFN